MTPLKGNALCNNKANVILRALMRECYYDKQEVKILSLAKPDEEKDFAFITLTTEEARGDLINNGLTYHSEHLEVRIKKDKDKGNPSGLWISITLVAKNLPQRESQYMITKTFKQILGRDNIFGTNFKYSSKWSDNRQPGCCHIPCLDAAV